MYWTEGTKKPLPDILQDRLSIIEGKLDHIDNEMKPFVYGIHDNMNKIYRTAWWLDERYTDIVGNVNISTHALTKQRESKIIMKESYLYPPILLRRIELFGLESLTSSEHQLIKEIKIIEYLKLVITEKWPHSTDINFSELTFMLDGKVRSFYYSKVSWFGFGKYTSTHFPVLENIKSTLILFEEINSHLEGRCKRSGILIVPEIEVSLTDN